MMVLVSRYAFLALESVQLLSSPEFHMWSTVLLWYQSAWLDAPLITAEGLGISLVLLGPTVVQIVRGRLVDSENRESK
jgi:hypothetical protein